MEVGDNGGLAGVGGGRVLRHGEVDGVEAELGLGGARGLACLGVRTGMVGGRGGVDGLGMDGGLGVGGRGTVGGLGMDGGLNVGVLGVRGGGEDLSRGPDLVGGLDEPRGLWVVGRRHGWKGEYACRVGCVAEFCFENGWYKMSRVWKGGKE